MKKYQPIIDFFIEIEPKTFEKKDSFYHKKIKAIFLEKYPQLRTLNKKDRFYVNIIFYFGKQHTRIDLDNLIKPILDSFTKLVWCDDTQVFELKSRKEQNNMFKGISIVIKKINLSSCQIATQC